MLPRWPSSLLAEFLHTKRCPLGLKNAGGAYQRLVVMVFRKQIGLNVEIYIDGIVIKSSGMEDYAHDLTETLDTLRNTSLKLNLAKSTFGVSFGKFLGRIISSKGLRAIPAKVNILTTMRSLSTVNEVQALTRRIAALSCFLFWSAD